MELTAIESNQQEILTIMNSLQSENLHSLIIGTKVMTEIYETLISKIKSTSK